ncbi:ribonuclease III [Actinospongicola halichondriae]|uniref:ribonuclease III n=1 Tax=Actinospongicola halichondriae TaxID=3236844 RepID=UPI003D467348
MSAAAGSNRRSDARALLLERLDYVPLDAALFDQAFNHRSWCAEHAEDESNERLEFLGDSVLGFVVADLVYRREAALDEGALTDVRKAVVNAVCLSEVALELDLGAHLRLGKGEEASGGREKPSILADAMEAVLGAVYLDGGIDAASDLVDRLLGDRMQAAIDNGGRNQDHKSRLQEHLAATSGATARYVFVATGPDHAREFTATVSAGGVELGVGGGRSKKQAEQQAARAALVMLESESESTDANHRSASGPQGSEGNAQGGVTDG